MFDDNRIHWTDEQIGGFKNKNVLELGPLEAGHTYLIEKLGASSVLGIESNARAYLKCLVVKEVMGMTKSHFLLGDFVPFLKENKKLRSNPLKKNIIRISINQKKINNEKRYSKILQ